MKLKLCMKNDNQMNNYKPKNVYKETLSNK